MRRLIIPLAILMGMGSASAQGGLQTWILVCAKSVAQGDCNLTTADRWYHLPAPQPSASTAAIKAAKAKVGREIDGGFYVAQEQFPAGISMGPHGKVFKACDSPDAASGAQEVEWAQRGSCLR